MKVATRERLEGRPIPLSCRNLEPPIRVGAVPGRTVSEPEIICGKRSEIGVLIRALERGYGVVILREAVRRDSNVVLEQRRGEPRALRVEPRIASNNQLSIQQMCEAGLGLALVGSMDAHEALQAGRLVRLLPEWSFGTLDIWAVTPQRDAQPAKVRQAIAALHAYLKQVPGISD